MRWISFFSILAISVSACGVDDRSYDQGMIVIGIDGMDYALSRQLMDEGHLPNLARLEKMGGFQ